MDGGGGNGVMVATIGLRFGVSAGKRELQPWRSLASYTIQNLRLCVRFRPIDYWRYRRVGRI